MVRYCEEDGRMESDLEIGIGFLRRNQRVGCVFHDEAGLSEIDYSFRRRLKKILGHLLGVKLLGPGLLEIVEPQPEKLALLVQSLERQAAQGFNVSCNAGMEERLALPVLRSLPLICHFFPLHPTLINPSKSHQQLPSLIMNSF
jgi:hypothetical protein